MAAMGSVEEARDMEVEEKAAVASAAGVWVAVARAVEAMAAVVRAQG